MELTENKSENDMENQYFEMCLFRHLYSVYNLAEQERMLKSQNVQPILDADSPASSISQYFRLMNIIDYSKLSSEDRQYIKKNFNRSSLEKSVESPETNMLFDKVIKEIQNTPSQYLVYRYDGSATPADTGNPFAFSPINRMAPANYVTFAIYYKQFDENCNEDDCRNYNIAAKCGNALQNQHEIAIVCISEADMFDDYAAENSVWL